MNWYLTVLKKYAVFSGRASRQEFWMFTLFDFIFGIVATIINIVLFGRGGFDLLGTLYALVLLIPRLAVGVRRLHDVGKSGWMLLISLIPIIGAIWLLILFVADSNPGENKYGPNPNTPATNS